MAWRLVHKRRIQEGGRRQWQRAELLREARGVSLPSRGFKGRQSRRGTPCWLSDILGLNLESDNYAVFLAARALSSLRALLAVHTE